MHLRAQWFDQLLVALDSLAVVVLLHSLERWSRAFNDKLVDRATDERNLLLAHAALRSVVPADVIDVIDSSACGIDRQLANNLLIEL